MERVLRSSRPRRRRRGSWERRWRPLLLPGDVVSLTETSAQARPSSCRDWPAPSGSTARVTSPTFHASSTSTRAAIPIVHLDVYRLDSFQEVLDLGFEELLDPEAILVVEWGEAVGPCSRALSRGRAPAAARPEPENDRAVSFRPGRRTGSASSRPCGMTAEALLDAASRRMIRGKQIRRTRPIVARDHRRWPRLE